MTSEADSVVRSHTFPLNAGGSVPTHGDHDAATRLGNTLPVASSTMMNAALAEHQTYIGPTTEFEPALLRLTAKKNGATKSETVRSLGQASFLTDQSNSGKLSDVNAAGLRHRVGELEKTVRPHIARMAVTYRKHVHDAFPILDDGVLARLQTGNMSGCDPLVAAAITLLAMPWYSKQPDNPAISELEYRKLEGLAFGLFQQSLYQPTLNTVLAGLLLMQCRNVDTKALNTQLAEITFELGLHLDCSGWSMDESVLGLRRRLAWGVFVQDKWSSIIHGRPCAVSTNNWSVQPLTETDWPNSISLTETPENKDRRQLLFIELMNLTEHLHTILNQFYSVLAMQRIQEKGPRGLRAVLQAAKDVQIRLKSWYTELPASLRVEGSSSSTSTSSSPNRGPASSASFLRLAYHTTEITLHRSIIRNQPTAPLEDAHLTSIVRMAAKERLISAMDFANRLRPAQLAGFWLFPSKVCFAIIGSFGALLAATAPAEEECTFYKARLREYRWTLAMAGKEAGWLKHASRTVDEQIERLEGMQEKPGARELAEMLAKVQADEVRVQGQKVVQRERAATGFEQEGFEEAMEDEEEDSEDEGEGDEGEGEDLDDLEEVDDEDMADG